MGSIQSRNNGQMFGSMLGDAVIPGSNSFLAILNNYSQAVPPWSIFPMFRDRYLRNYFKREPIWTGAVYSMVSRVQSLNYVMNGADASKAYLRDIFKNADFGGGLKQLIGKTIQDALTQDNGIFWELVGPGNPERPLLGAITEVNYLDPAQCWRTFDKEFPVIYINPIHGTEHKLHWSRVHMDSNMTQPNELARGIGFSATSRLLQQIQLAVSMLQYRYEKVTGKQRQAILHGTGVNAKTLRNALSRIDALEDDDQTASYENIPILSTVKGVELNLLTLAGLPDNFDIMDETTLYVYICALVLGTDAREIWPSTSVGATKADATVQNMKARGKGIADLITIVDKALNRVTFSIDPTLQGEFDDIDDEADNQTKEVQSKRVITLMSLQDKGVIDADVTLAHAIQEGILNPDLVANPTTIPGVNEMTTRREEVVEGEERDPQGNPLQADPEASGDPEPRDEKASSEDTYRRSLSENVRALWKGHMGLYEFVQAYDSAVTRGLTRAAYEGIAEFGLSPTDMTDEERSKLRSIINKELTYVWSFGQKIVVSQQVSGGKLSPLLDRVSLWVNRYVEVYELFKSFAAKDKKLKWIVNPQKEHCVDCLRLEGRIYRGSIWAKYEISPRSFNLNCSGLKCGCSFVATNDKVTPGRPPKLVGPKGRKDLEDHTWHSHSKQSLREFPLMLTNTLQTYEDALRMFRNQYAETTKKPQEHGTLLSSSMLHLHAALR
jgi:hypothetical protein